jgi:hypothetical protein
VRRRVGMDRIVGAKYKLGRKIGSGSFGEIYLGSISLSLSLTPYPSSSSCFSPFFDSVLGSDVVFAFFLFSAATHVDTYEIVAVKIVSSLPPPTLMLDFASVFVCCGN